MLIINTKNLLMTEVFTEKYKEHDVLKVDDISKLVPTYDYSNLNN